MEALLRAEHLKKQFHRNADGKHAVNDVSFEIMPGECLGLIGESGSGKSTIAKILTGIESATEGNLYFEGNPILGKHVRKDSRYADDFSESKVVAQSENDHWTKFRRRIAVL